MARRYSLSGQGRNTRWGIVELDPLEGTLVLSFPFFFQHWFGLLAPWTNVTLSMGFADKERTSPRLSLVNVPVLNYLLRSEIFVSVDGQLLAAPLILDYIPLSRSLVDAGQAIRAGSPRLACIDVSILGFPASRDLPPIQLLAQHVLPIEVVLEEEAGSLQSS